MISNPNFICYACIAKGTTVLAEYSSNEPKIEELAAECVAKAPPHHSLFSHTVKKRTYTFVFDEPFVYFAIFDEHMVKSEQIRFLNRMKCAFDKIIQSRGITRTGSDDFTTLSFQSQLHSVFREAMGLDLDSVKDSLPDENKDSQNPNMDSVKVKRSLMVPLIGEPIKGLKKKKRVVGMESSEINGKEVAVEKKVEVCADMNGFISKNNILNDRQKAKQIWKKHVWVVLLLDVFVCAILFVIWLWVCSGFKCMES